MQGLCGSGLGLHRQGPQCTPPGYWRPYPAWGLPNRKYTRAGMMAHIEEHGRGFRVTQADGSVRL